MTLAGDCLAGSSPVGKVFVVRELDGRQPCALAPREVISILGCGTRKMASTLREGILWNNPSRFQISNSRTILASWRGFSKGPSGQPGNEGKGL